MGSLGDEDDEMTTIERGSASDLIDSETQPFDSQFSPQSLSGTVLLEDAFETQVVNFGGGTQILDDTVYVENVDVVNFGGDTQILNDTDYAENVDTQLLDECNNDVAVNGDGEGIDRTEVFGDTEELPDDDSVKEVGKGKLDVGNAVHTSLCKQCDLGFKEESKAFSYEHRSPDLHVPTVTPLDNDTPEPKTGPERRSFTSVRAASLRASGLAARRKASKVINSGSCSIRSDSQALKEHTAEDDGVPFIRNSSNFREEIDEELVLRDHNEQMNGLRNENKCRVGSSTVRKLFMEDTDAEIKGHNDYTNNANGEADLPQLLTYNNGLAGLSYVDSQEPGESSQANALDVVDRLLKFSVTEFDKEVGFGKSTGEKSKNVSSAKGTQSLAKIVNLKSAGGERGIFDWDDNREDEGGGQFFSRRKEVFFDNESQRCRSFTQTRKPQHVNSKGSGVVNKPRDKEEQQVTEAKFRKNLIKELDEQLNMDLSDGKEAAGTDMDMEDMLNVGLDTQVAAEAMEALCHGVDVTDSDFNDANQDGKNMSKSYPRRKTNIRAHSKQNSFNKRASSSNCRVITRQSEKTKRIGTELNKESSVPLPKQSKNVKKQCDTELVKAIPKRAKSCAEEHFATNVRENSDIIAKVVKRRKEERAFKRSDIKEVDRCHVTASSSGRISVRKRRLQEQLGTYTPIACRTRQSRLANQLKGAVNATNGVEEINDQTGVGTLKGKSKSCSGFDAFEVLNAKERIFELGSNESEKLKNFKLTEHEQSNQKITGTTIVKIDELSNPRGRRTRRKVSGQFDGAVNICWPSNQSVEQEANGQSIANFKISKTNAISTCMDLGIKRQTRSSACAGSVLLALDTRSKRRSFQRSVDKVGPGGAALNCNSVDINGSAIPKDMVGAQAFEHTDGKSDADTTLSADGARVNSRSGASPRDGCKQFGSACATPANCTTPINAASPICMGDEYLKQSCRKNLSRSSLMKEINSLIVDGLPTSAMKDTRRRREMANVHVLFSHHLDEDTIKQQKKILARLGASVASSISDATHFITDNFVRTRNMLEAIAFGKPVVTHLWIESCGQASCFIDEKTYILRDAKKEKEFGFSLPVSLARACQHPLLQGQKVYITPNTKPGKELLASLVKAVHGLAVERIGRAALKDDNELLVLSCEEDFEVCMPFLERGAAVYSSELLLNGIVTQKLEYERHRLFVDHVKRTRSTIWPKKGSNKCLPVTK